MSTEIKASPVYGLAKRFSLEPAKLVEVLRATVIKPDKNGKSATNEEVAAFCVVAEMYQLNPFTREIHAFASGDKGIVPIVGIDGWARIVNSHPDFDGCEFEEREAPDGTPVSITCKMHVRGRSQPICVTERYSECKRQSIPWNTMPWRMLRHKAFMQAARYAFSLSGIYDEDEGRDIVSGGQSVTTKREPVPMPRAVGQVKAEPPAEEALVDEETLRLLGDEFQRLSMSAADIKNALSDSGALDVKTLTLAQANRLLDALR